MDEVLSVDAPFSIATPVGDGVGWLARNRKGILGGFDAWRAQVSDAPPQPTPSRPMEALIGAVAARRDREAFTALFEYFAPRLKSFMLRQGTDGPMAEEIVQETMVNVWRKAGQFDAAKASASTWVFTIARNMRIDMLRKANRPEPDANDPSWVPDPEPQAFDLVSRDQQAAGVHRAMAALPAEQQDVLRLAFFEDLPHGEVAERLGVPLGTVKSRIRLAMKRIRSELGDGQ